VPAGAPQGPRPDHLSAAPARQARSGPPRLPVNPGADSFTVFRDGFLFVNKGAAITDGTGFMTCTR
jgi:hypothetical protein